MTQKLTFFKSAYYYTIGTVLSQGVNFIVLLILAKLMSVSDFAIITLYAFWVQIFAIIIGISSFYSLNNAKLDYGVQNMHAYTSATYWLGAMTFGAALIVILVFQNAFVVFLGFPLKLILFSVMQAFFLYAILQLSNEYRVLNKPIGFVLWSAVQPALRLVLSIVFVMSMSTNKYLGDIYGSVIAYGAAGAAASVVIAKNGKKVIDPAAWKYCAAISVPYIFTNLSAFVLGQSSRYMLERLYSLYESGIYSYVYNISMIGTTVWQACTNAWNVWYFDRTHAGKRDEILSLYNKYVWFVTLLTGVIVMLSPDVVRILGGQQYAAGARLVPGLMAGTFFMFLYGFPIAYETYKKKTAWIGIGAVGAGTFTIWLNFLLIPKYGGTGAAVATICGYVVLFIYHGFIAKFAVKGFEISFFKLLVPGIALAMVAVICYMLMDMVFARVLLAGVMGILGFRIFLRSRNIMMEST